MLTQEKLKIEEDRLYNTRGGTTAHVEDKIHDLFHGTVKIGLHKEHMMWNLDGTSHDRRLYGYDLVSSFS